MDPRLVIVLAAGFVALAGYICLSPDQFGFLGLPQAFLQLGMERTVTGLALMLLGFLVALSEAEGEEKRGPASRAQPFAFGGRDAAPADGELRLEPEPPQPGPDAELVLHRAAEASAGKRRPDLYHGGEGAKAPAAVPKSDSPPPPEP